MAPANGDAEDLVQRVELAARRRILDAGHVVPLDSSEWAERWTHLQQATKSK